MSELTPAPHGYPIKLVRDHTHRIINGTGEPGELFYGPLPPSVSAERFLKLKLAEEVGEFLVDGGLDELVDVLAVVEALAREHGVTLEQLVELMYADPRGRFLTGQMMYGRHAEFDGGAV